MIAAYDQATVGRLLDDRERQGFPRQCSDPAVLSLIVAALQDPEKKSARMDAAKHRALQEVSDDASAIDAAPLEA